MSCLTALIFSLQTMRFHFNNFINYSRIFSTLVCKGPWNSSNLFGRNIKTWKWKYAQTNRAQKDNFLRCTVFLLITQTSWYVTFGTNLCWNRVFACLLQVCTISCNLTWKGFESVFYPQISRNYSFKINYMNSCISLQCKTQERKQQSFSVSIH